MKRQVNRISIISVLVMVIFSSYASSEEGFVSLFNGNNLIGWEAVGTDAFEVKNNAIYTNGKSPYPSWLASAEEYENFVLHFEYKTEGWYEGGVLLFAPKDGPSSKLGMKLHLRHDQHPLGVHSPGAIYDAAEPMAFVNKPSGQWNQCVIESDWPRLRIMLNGTVIHDIDRAHDKRFFYRMRKGHIGIQNLGCRAYFRNIEIKPLPGKEEWQPLFSEGLDGLRFEGETDWSMDGDTLTGKGKNGFAITKQSFDSPYELQVWAKTIVNGNGGVNFHFSDEGHGIEIQVFNAPDSTNPTGSFYGIAPAERIASRDEEWFLIDLFTDGPYGVVYVNGEKVAETHSLPSPHQGPVAFQQHTPGATIHYRGARIKPWERLK